MKYINIRNSALFMLCILGFLMVAVRAYPANNFKLKTGAQGQICLKCHEKYKETFKSRYMHPLFKTGDCSGCHVPHASSHKNLLTKKRTKLCYDCHKKVLPDNARSAHRVVVDGDCQKCHSSHGSNNKFILLKPGNALCLDCHKDIEDAIKNKRFSHDPMQKGRGCLNCHDPHSSTRLDFLLKKDAPSLCLGCHKTNKPSFAKKHMNYNVADSNCRSCHNPHGSDTKGLLFAEAHTPVLEKKCSACHFDPSTANLRRTKKQGAELCRQCHKEMMDKTFDKNRVHWPMLDQQGCLHCHTPHAAKQKKLLKGPVVNVCSQCHSDTRDLQKLSIDNPKNPKVCEPVRTGNCIACHAPHSSDNLLLFARSPVVELCGECHEWQTHSSHPIGEKIIDQRNKNLTLDCLSCHRGCGTVNHPQMLQFDNTYEVCIQCHLDRRRQ